MWNGDVLRNLRQKKGVSIKHLADQVGVSRPYISQLELGQRSPSDTFIEKLADYFSVKAETFSQFRVISGAIQGGTHSKEHYDNTSLTTSHQNIVPPPPMCNRFSAHMLIGVIRGVHNDISIAVRNCTDDFPSFVIAGLLVRNSLQQESHGNFQLVVTREYLSLRLHLPDRNWGELQSLTEGQKGAHVILLENDDDVLNPEFTDYTSVYYRNRQCHMWSEQGKHLKMLTPCISANQVVSEEHVEANK